PPLQLNIEDLLSGFDSMKLSALRNAAKLSPLIKERTIGPDCADLSRREVSITILPAAVDSNDTTKENDPNASNEGPSSIHGTPKSEEKKKNAPVTPQFTAIKHSDPTDCTAVQSKLHQQELERQRLASVQKALAERHNKIRLADEQREAQLAKSLHEASLNVARKVQDSEQRLLHAVREQEKLAQAAAAQRQAQMEEENKRLNDIQAQLKRRQEEMRRKAQLIETVRQSIGQFRVGTETFTKALTVIGVQHATKFTNQKKAIRTLQKDFEQLLQGINANQEVSQVEVDQAADYCRQLDQVNVEPVSPECLQFYNEIKSFYEQHQTAVKQLMDDPSMKTYRFNCQKAINVPVNAISAVNREHFIDKYSKLAALLSGQNVKAGDGMVSINGHPLGRTYCTMLLAKKFVSQADTSISSNASAAFPVAAIAVALWQRFPDFGRFFLAYLHRECPYLVPYYLPQHEGQSQEEFLKTLGYRFADGGVLEKQDQYLKRMSGLARLYAAVIVTVPRKDDPTPHPHGLEYGWRWLTNILNRFPQPDICATLIAEFLQTAGSELHAAYGKQFLKVLRVLQGDYMSALNRIDTGGPKARLEGLIAKILTEGRIERPEGIMSVNFW
ncbi:AGAP012004-PA, partial [Anopheles gambiae str. PEST]